MNTKPTALFFVGLCLLFFVLAIMLLSQQLPAHFNLTDLFRQSADLEVLLLQNYSLPRIVMALLAGGTLGLASLLLQQIMANNLVSDSTIGISSGAQFALFLATILFPASLHYGASLIALGGAVVSLLLVFCLAWRKTMSPLLLILAGLVVNLYFGAFSSLMMLFYPEESRGLALWGAGSLVQESWHDSQWLIWQICPMLLIIALLIRPLTILSLNESNAVSLGVPVARLRFIGIAVASYLIACVVSAVGMLGFIGLVATTLVRQLGVRSLKYQLILAFYCGGLLLAITDLLLQLLALWRGIHLPTGAVTALLGTPLLLWLMFRTLPKATGLNETATTKQIKFRPHFIGIALLLLFAVIFVALNFGRSGQGWHWLNQDNLQDIVIALRYPRLLMALAVGILLATAGVLLQRLTLNPMASPELLGISSGTSMGILLLLFFFSSQSPVFFWLAGIIGALLALSLLLLINQANGMLPEKVLLTGISLSALFDTLQRLAIASGDPRAILLLNWTSGSIQPVESHFAWGFLLISLALFSISLLFSRWLEILGLQAPMAQALGLNLRQVRWILILFSALLTAIATLIIGPLSFIGLLVPHLARLVVARVYQQLIVAALLGGIIMIMADWLGRQLLFPYEIPAGLVATLLGGSYFLVMMRKV
ncbi:Fe3+-hydroxamate ABC transporter permease FhuB [Volucribacter amazonae]|uniref:Fe3+-hydroxamate ABC transporter permease FhuB n=1 Tax=Volucribacter amazonae TaxID=256731 RepID=A0A9X4SL94_9PAST|nr:Fe(3+)-hydroxamate ABC transporter permease FhuB [Volucribacter amazonae]MDG6894823.1 Fe3+-hydroxamate ABC transporter permease FhuB [Volucribacter amazonae]